MVRRKLGFSDCLTVSALGRNGGLALLWKNDVKVDIVNFSQSHISAWMEVEGVTPRWFFTGFYGEPKASKRNSSWNLLKVLKPHNITHWIVMGDFNEILFHNEKWGGKDRSEKQMARFREALDFCSLNDLGLRGNQFT